jgi:UPF0716 protein FxsA
MQRPARSGCLMKLLAVLIVLPLVELWLLLVLARFTNILVALSLVVITGVAGTLLIRTQGLRTMRRVASELQQGRLPTDALLDAALIFCGGALLLTPGMLTDVVGITMLIPYSRTYYRRAFVQWIRTHTRVQAWTGEARSEIVDAYVIEPPDDKRR